MNTTEKLRKYAQDCIDIHGVEENEMGLRTLIVTDSWEDIFFQALSYGDDEVTTLTMRYMDFDMDGDMSDEDVFNLIFIVCISNQVVSPFLD